MILKSLFDNEILEVLYITKVKFMVDGKNLYPVINNGEGPVSFNQEQKEVNLAEK